MKKKFVLTLALVLMVAATLTAAPLEIGGEFSASRKFTFDPNTVTPKSLIELKTISVSGDFWKLSIDRGYLVLGSDLIADGVTFDEMNGKVDIYLDKALAAQGLDMGDITLTLGVGNKKNSNILSVYGDPNDSLDDFGYLRMVGVAAMGTTELTVGYTDMLTVKAGLNFDSAAPFVVSAKVAPVDGVVATVGFSNSVALGDTKGGIGGSVKVDVAALAGLDFDLYASAYDYYHIDAKDNFLFATVGGGYADIAVDAEFVMTGTNDLKFNASYSGIENVGISAGLDLIDLSDIAVAVSGAVDYTMGGVKYKLKAAYDDVAKFSLTPSVTIKF